MNLHTKKLYFESLKESKVSQNENILKIFCGIVNFCREIVKNSKDNLGTY